MKARRRWLKGPGPLQRDPSHRVIAGVAAGVALRTGINVRYVRAGFVVLALLSGSGVAAYLIAWLVIPATGERVTIAARAMSDRQGIALAAGLGSLLVALLVVVSVLGGGWVGTLAWPLVISVAGVVLLLRNAPSDEQAILRALVDPLLGIAGDTTLGRTALRVSISVLLLAGAVGTLLLGHARSVPILQPLAGVAFLIAAIVVLLGPWWLRITRDLVTERQARIRAEERADMATRVHDSVLQTLALIQRRADEPQEVIQLARAQERELRSWLFEGRPPGSPDVECTTLSAGVRRIQSDVEAQQRVAVEIVLVGDCDLDHDLGALLAAAREATVNAAKWSGAGVVSLFCEVEPTGVTIFVRDRGRGFDPGAVPADRKGLAESIRARMTRHGGTADIRSSHGEGTEVRLTMPRAAGVTQPARV